MTAPDAPRERVTVDAAMLAKWREAANAIAVSVGDGAGKVEFALVKAGATIDELRLSAYLRAACDALAAHAAAVAEAEARGVAKGLAEVDAACATISADDARAGVRLVETVPDRWGVVLPDDGGIMRARIRQTPTAALIDHAAALRAEEADDAR